jgi:xanthine dehydrogenase accessory factor
MNKLMAIYQKIIELNQTNVPFALATVVKTQGTVPGKTGFKILVETSGKTTGTVGGGEIEKRVINESLEKLTSGQSGLQEYLLREKATHSAKSSVPVIPMMCHGRVWIYYEISQKLAEIYIFGGGHVGQALCRFLAHLNYRIILIDNRKEFANKERNPFTNEIVCDDFIKFTQKFQPSSDAFIVIMTHEHNYDYEILKILYQRQLELRYIGVIASKTKSIELRKKLKKHLGEKLNLKNLYSPIGIDIGGSTESQIALSVAAEIQAITFQKFVSHLRDKT